MTNYKILIIGSSGRLGKALQAQLQGSTTTIMQVGRTAMAVGNREYSFTPDSPSLHRELKRWQPDLVVNMAAVWGSGVSERDTLETSYKMPMRVAEQIDGKGVAWLQVDSYFNLYFDSQGVDKDFYSRVKRRFAEDFRVKFPDFAFTQIMAPHLVGDDEPKNRLFRDLAEGHLSGEPFALGSGNQYVPFVAMSDAAKQVAWLVGKNRTSYGSLPQALQLKRIDCLTVREINDKFAEQLNSLSSLAMFGSLPDGVNEFYQEVTSEFIYGELPDPLLSIRAILGGITVTLKGNEKP